MGSNQKKELQLILVLVEKNPVGRSIYQLKKTHYSSDGRQNFYDVLGWICLEAGPKKSGNMGIT